MIQEDTMILKIQLNELKSTYNEKLNEIKLLRAENVKYIDVKTYGVALQQEIINCKKNLKQRKLNQKEYILNQKKIIAKDKYALKNIEKAYKFDLRVHNQKICILQQELKKLLLKINNIEKQIKEKTNQYINVEIQRDLSENISAFEMAR